MRYPRIVDGFLIKEGTEGFGIFAQKAYPKGALLATFTGTVIKDADKRLSHRALQLGSAL